MPCIAKNKAWKIRTSRVTCINRFTGGEKEDEKIIKWHSINRSERGIKTKIIMETGLGIGGLLILAILWYILKPLFVGIWNGIIELFRK